MTEQAPGSAAAFGIFATLLTLHLSLKLYARIASSDRWKPEERQLVKEIKELNRSANELSTPATFAKSAKLKRQAAAKEKELTQRKFTALELILGVLAQRKFDGILMIRQELSLRKGWLPLSTIFPRALKVAVYLLLALWFWRTSVATVPVALLKPSDIFLKMGRRDASGELIAVGIIPWLVLSSRVGEFLSEKIVGKPPQKPRILLKRRS